MPFAAIAISVVCFAQQVPTTQSSQLLFEVFPEKGFNGTPFGSNQIPAAMPFPPRSLKVFTNSLLEFRVDTAFNTDAAGVLISRGPVSVPDLSSLPKRSCTLVGNQCVAIPAGNWDGVIVTVRGGAPNVPCGDNNTTVYTVIGCPPPPHRLSDAEFQTSDSPPRNQAVYRIQLSSDTNTCLAFDPDDDTGVPLNNCGQEQKKDFTLIPAPNKCWFIRNGNVKVPPITGRCLFVDHDGDTGDRDKDSEVGAGICAPTDQEHWKLVLRDGKYNLINQRSAANVLREAEATPG